MSSNLNFISNDHNVYILGAGFSWEAGYRLIADFTMKMRDAWEWFRDYCSQKR